MKPKTRLLHCAVFVAACLFIGVALVPHVPTGAAAPIPERLTDKQFWDLSKEWSEEDGTFRSDNLLSNETGFQYIIPDLLKTAKQGRVYMGVGPEQNFTYIAALKPSMAVIIDIRHGNLDVHLMYKALFELSEDRADFVSRLFSRKRPSGLTTKSSADEIFKAYLAASGDKTIYEQNLKAIEDVLMKKHGLPLTPGDLEGIRWAFGNYYQFGPSINYGSSLSANIPPAIVGAAAGYRQEGLSQRSRSRARVEGPAWCDIHHRGRSRRRAEERAGDRPDRGFVQVRDYLSPPVSLFCGGS